MEFIDLKKQYALMKTEIDTAIESVLSEAKFIMGPAINELESKLAEYVGTKFAVGVSSGTDALMVSLMALGVGRSDYLITTPFTFIATVEVAVLLGAIPVFVDVDEETLNISPQRIEDAVKEYNAAGKTIKGIITVSLYGQPSDHDEIGEIAKRYGIWVLEDACQSFGANYKERKSCNISEVAVTSFFPSKPLGCYGDGGMIFTQDGDLAELFRGIRVHGQKQRYMHDMVGINARLDTLQAAVLLAKWPHFPEELKRRGEIAKRYTEELRNVVRLVPVKPDRSSVFAQYTIRIEEKYDTERRAKISSFLKDSGIPTAIHYPMPLHLQQAFKYLGYKEEDFPVAEKAAKEVLSLPMHPWLTEEEQYYVISHIKKAVKIYE